MLYNTVMKLKIFCVCSKGHTTALFLAFCIIVDAEMGEGSLPEKPDIRSAKRCNFSSFFYSHYFKLPL